jgi:hypothetical protein
MKRGIERRRMLVVGPRNKQVMVCLLVKTRKQKFRRKQGRK